MAERSLSLSKRALAHSDRIHRWNGFSVSDSQNSFDGFSYVAHRPKTRKRIERADRRGRRTCGWTAGPMAEATPIVSEGRSVADRSLRCALAKFCAVSGATSGRTAEGDSSVECPPNLCSFEDPSLKPGPTPPPRPVPVPPPGGSEGAVGCSLRGPCELPSSPGDGIACILCLAHTK